MIAAEQNQGRVQQGGVLWLKYRFTDAGTFTLNTGTKTEPVNHVIVAAEFCLEE